MATYTWKSDSDGNWNTGASWDQGSAPGVGDDVVFPASSIQSVTDGLDQSAAGKFNSIKLFTGYTGEIGNDNNPLIAESTEVIHNGSGGLFYKCDALQDLITINCAGIARNVIYGDGTGDVTDVRVASGNVELIGLDCENLYVTEAPKPSGGGVPSRVIVDFSCDDKSSLFLNRGIVVNHVKATTVVVSGGTYITEGSSGGSSFLHLLGGHVVVKSTETLTIANVMGGLLDYTQDTRPKTISNLRVWPGATAILPDYVTVTAGGPLVEPPYHGA